MNDPLAKITGMTPRYLRWQQAAEREQARVPVKPLVAVEVADEIFANLRSVDAFTADLRRRVTHATRQPRRLANASATPT
jgi:hypothetical protein